jgi:ATP-dependent Lon protease
MMKNSVFFIEYGDFVSDNSTFIKHKLDCKFQNLINRENKKQEEKNRELFILDLPSDHKEALKNIRDQITAKDLDYSLLMRILTSRNLMAVANSAWMYLTEQRYYYYSKSLLHNYALENLQKKKDDEFQNEIYKILKSSVEKNPDSSGLHKLFSKMQNKTVPEHVMSIFDEEYEKLLTMSSHSSEYANIKSYLTCISTIPFGIKTEDNFDIFRAKKILGNFPKISNY